MIEKIKQEITIIIKDAYKLMDTTTPQGIHPQLYMHLKYANHNLIYKFTQKHDIPLQLLEKLAMYNYLQKTDEEIMEQVTKYLVET